MFAYQKVRLFDIKRTLRGLVYQHNFIREGGVTLPPLHTLYKKPPHQNDPVKGCIIVWIVYWFSSLKGYIGATILLYLYVQRGLIVIQQTF